MCDKNLNSSYIISLKISIRCFFIQKVRTALLSGIGMYGEKQDAGTEMYQKLDSVLTAPCVPALHVTNPTEVNRSHIKLSLFVTLTRYWFKNLQVMFSKGIIKLVVPGLQNTMNSDDSF